MLHIVVDDLGNPVSLLLSAGNDHGSIHAVELLGRIELCGSNILADRAHGTQSIPHIMRQKASYAIPPKSNVSDP